MVLLVTQIILLFSLPILGVLFWLVPGVVPILFAVTFCVATWVVMRLLNGAPTTECLVGLPGDLEPVNDEHELWFFINGVATGSALYRYSRNLILNDIQKELATIKPEPPRQNFSA